MIVTGVDGSAGSTAALRWALDEAHLRQSALVAVRAWPGISDLVRRSREGLARVAREQAQLDSDVRSEISADCPATVANMLVEGEPAEALMSLASDLAADMIVVGRRGYGGVVGLLLGSVSRACVTRADRTVVVVPAGERIPRHRQVVVGVAGTETDAAVLRWAARAAVARGAELVVVHAYEGIAYGNDAAVEHDVLRRVETGVRDAIGEHTAYRMIVDEADPDRALLAAARDGELLVLGAARYNAVERALGTTATRCVEHATAPVVVVRTASRVVPRARSTTRESQVAGSDARV